MSQNSKLTDECQPPPGFDDDTEGVELHTLGDVRRELARVHRLTKRNKLTPQVAGVLFTGLGVLAKSMEASDVRQYTDEELVSELKRRRAERQASGAEQ